MNNVEIKNWEFQPIYDNIPLWVNLEDLWIEDKFEEIDEEIEE